MPRARAVSRIGLALGVAVVLLTGAGCSPDQFGTAARVGGEQISVSQLQAATRDLVEARGGQSPAAAAPGDQPGGEQRDVLNRLVITQLMQRVAAQEGVNVSEGDVDALNSRFVQLLGPDRLRQELLQIGVPPSAQREFVRYQATRLALGRKLVPGDPQQVQDQQVQAADNRLAQAGKEVPVEINPRYGRWQPDQLRIEGAISGGLSKTPAELAPSGTPASGAPAPQPSPS